MSLLCIVIRCVCARVRMCVCVCVSGLCGKVGGRVDRVSGTKPPPKINSVPVSLSLCMSSCRPVGSDSSINSSNGVWGQAACHRNNMSSAPSLP